MQGKFVEGEKDERTGEACAILAVIESLRACKADQVRRARVGVIAIVIVCPAVDRACECRDCNVVIEDAVLAPIPFDLSSRRRSALVTARQTLDA